MKSSSLDLEVMDLFHAVGTFILKHYIIVQAWQEVFNGSYCSFEKLNYDFLKLTCSGTIFLIADSDAKVK